MNSLSVEATVLINHVFKSLCGAKPSWRSGFRGDDDVKLYKEALALTFIENGIQTPDAVQKGLAEARKDESPFMPSTGEFLKWCKPDKTTQNLYISPPSYSLTDEERKRFTAMSKNLLESMK